LTAREREIEAKLVSIVEKWGGNCLKWVCPGWAGVPDRIILLPGGSVIFAETKRPKGGKFSPMQRWWERRLVALGMDYWRVRNYDDLADIERYIAEVMRT
jgi:hypothetical protein